MSKFKYIIKVNGNVVFTTNDPTTCAVKATHITDWREMKMYTNDPKTDFIHFHFDPKL